VPELRLCKIIKCEGDEEAYILEEEAKVYGKLVPYFTEEVALSLVVQVMVVEVWVIEEVAIKEIVGGVISETAWVVAEAGDEEALMLPAAS
jgi:uncharacterized membrane protein YecN with MAPEG domain